MADEPKCAYREHEDNVCSISLICGRCDRCLLHCVCAPEELQPSATEKINLGNRLIADFVKRKV